MESDSETKSEDVYHDAARHFLDVQLSTHDVLDNKAAQSFSVGSVVLPVTFALLNLSAIDVPRTAEVALGVALAFYGLLLVSASIASLMRGLEYRPNIPTLKQHSQSYLGVLLKRWVAEEYERSSLANEKMLVKKARWVGVAILALYLEAFFLWPRSLHYYCDLTSFGGGRGLGVRTTIFDGPGGGVGWGRGLVV